MGEGPVIYRGDGRKISGKVEIVKLNHKIGVKGWMGANSYVRVFGTTVEKCMVWDMQVWYSNIWA